jgi:chorismate synthase
MAIENDKTPIFFIHLSKKKNGKEEKETQKKDRPQENKYTQNTKYKIRNTSTTSTE